MCFDFLYNFCLTHFSLQEELSDICSKMCIGLHVQYRYYCEISIKLKFSRQIFQKYLSIKFHEKPSSENRVIADGRTDMTKLIVYFRNFSRALKKDKIAPTHIRREFYF